MAHVLPTAQDVLTRFPELTCSNVERLNMIIDELETEVDTGWREKDYKNGVLYLAAHRLVMEDAKNGGANAALGQGPLKSQSFGDASETYATTSEGGVGSEYDLTVYGRYWLKLLRRNAPHVLVV
jgi:hypothetical protein